MREIYRNLLDAIAVNVSNFISSPHTQSLEGQGDFYTLLAFTANIARDVDTLTQQVCKDLNAKKKIEDVADISALLRAQQERFMQHVEKMLGSTDSDISGSMKLLIDNFVGLGNGIMLFVSLVDSLRYANDKSAVLAELQQQAADVSRAKKEIDRSGHDYTKGVPNIQMARLAIQGAEVPIGGASSQALVTTGKGRLVTRFTRDRQAVLAASSVASVAEDGGFLSLQTASLRELALVKQGVDTLSEVIEEFKAKDRGAGDLLTTVIGQAGAIAEKTYKTITTALLQKAHISRQIRGNFTQLKTLLETFRNKAKEAIKAVPESERLAKQDSLVGALRKLDKVIRLCDQLISAEQLMLTTGGEPAAPGPLKQLMRK